MSIFDSIREFITGFLPEDLQDEAEGYLDDAEGAVQEKSDIAQEDLLG